MRRELVLPWASLLAACALALGCAGAADSGGGGAIPLEVRFRLMRGAGLIECSAAPEISAVQVVVFASDGLTMRTGFPVPADCARGAVSVSLPAGDSVLELRALGELDGTRDSVLYRSRTAVTAPVAGPLELSLRPEVAFLVVAWSFPEQGCPAEVQAIDLVVSAGGGQAPAFRDRLACDDTPFTVPRPLRADRFTIRADAVSSAEAVLYSATAAMMALERGDNRFDLSLEPSGGRLLLDWVFDTGGPTAVRMCDLAGVTEVRAEIRAFEGGPLADEIFPCTSPRPYAFRSSRFTPGRRLHVALSAAHPAGRYRGSEEVLMPQGDRFPLAPLALERVGTASVSIQVRTSSCSSADRYVLTAHRRTAGGDVPVHSEQQASSTFLLEDLPYATYLLRAESRDGGQLLCAREEERTLDAPTMQWMVEL